MLHYLWLCRTKELQEDNLGTLFLSRAPELASLSTRSLRGERDWTEIVYPDPPMLGDEVKLFGAV